MDLKLLNQYQQSPMSEAQSSLLFVLLMGQNLPEEARAGVEGGFLGQVLGKRLDYYLKDNTEFSVSPDARLFCVYLCTGPGDAVMYAHTLYHLAAKRKGVYGVRQLAEDFTRGFPSVDERRKAWEAQKGYVLGLDCDNYLDTPEAWQV